VRLVDAMFVVLLVVFLLTALMLGTFLRVAQQEPTPVPYVTPSPQILR
jgi:hypothetical protein